MPNGQYHGKKNRLGIRIKNPLPMSVEVDILDGKGYGTCRTLRPGAEVYVKVPHPGEYDITTSIIRYDQTGQSHSLGEAGAEEVSTQPLPPLKSLVPGPKIIHKTSTLHTRRWKNIVVWNIPQGLTGALMAISIQIAGDAEARVDLPHTGSQIVSKDTTLSYKNNILLIAGDAVRVKGRCKVGNGGTVEVMMQGQLYPVGTPVPAGKGYKGRPEHITEKTRRKEPEEPPLRSLGEMIEEMKRREEVKV